MKISLEYTDYVAVFFPKLAIELLENIGINGYAIKLVESKEPVYRPIYSLGLIE